MNHQPPARALTTHLQPLLGGGVELCAGARNLGRFADAAAAEKTRAFLAGQAKPAELRAPSFEKQIQREALREMRGKPGGRP